MSRAKRSRVQTALEAYLELELSERRIYKEMLESIERKCLIARRDAPLVDQPEAPVPRRPGRPRKVTGQPPDGTLAVDKG